MIEAAEAVEATDRIAVDRIPDVIPGVILDVIPDSAMTHVMTYEEIEALIHSLYREAHVAVKKNSCI